MGGRVSPGGTGAPDDERFEWPPTADNKTRLSSEIGTFTSFAPPGTFDRGSQIASFGTASTAGRGSSAPRVPADGLSQRSPATAPRSARSRGPWRRRIGLSVFGLCAIGVAALGWYIGQIAPQVSGATRTSVAELPTGTPVHAPVDARGAATKAAHRVSRSATGAHGLSDAGAPHGSDTGTLVVKSEPAGARISIDGRASGVTPATFRRVAPGEHRISLTHGAIVINQVARVESAGTVTVVASLRAPSTGFGWIAASAPVELDVAENGELLGTTRSRRIMLPEGPHTLEVSNAALGYRDTAQVRIVAGEVIPLRISLPTSVVHVNAIPWAEVWIDGKPLGQTPIGNVPTELGSHAVLFRHPELGERTVTVMVKNGVPTRVTADLRVR